MQPEFAPCSSFLVLHNHQDEMYASSHYLRVKDTFVIGENSWIKVRLCPRVLAVLQRKKMRFALPCLASSFAVTVTVAVAVAVTVSVTATATVTGDCDCDCDCDLPERVWVRVGVNIYVFVGRNSMSTK